MAGSSAPRAATESPGTWPSERPSANGWAPVRLRAILLEGTVAVMLTLVFFAGFLALLAVVFPVGQDLRVLLQSDRQMAAPTGSSAQPTEGHLAGPIGDLLASIRVLHPAVRKRLAGAIAWTQAATGSEFRSGDGIQTGLEGRALVEIGSAKIRLESNSLVILGAEAQRSSGLAALTAAPRGLVVIQGEVAARIEGGAENTFSVALPTGVASVRGADGSTAEVVVTVDPDRSAVLTSIQGSVALESNGRRVDLGPRQFVRVGKSGGFSEPLPIPDTPILESPASGATYPFLDLPPKVRFNWRSAEGPGEWRLVVSRDGAFDDIVVDERATTNSFEWGRLGPGRYQWRVVRLVAGVPSAPSSARHLVVTRETQPLALAVEPPPARVDGLQCVIRGRTAPNATVYVRGRRVDVGAGGTFEAEVTLEPGANIVLVEAVASGGQNVHSSYVIHAKP